MMLVKLKTRRGELPARTSRMIEAQTSLHPGAVLEVEVDRSQISSDEGPDGYTYHLRAAVLRGQCAVVVAGPMESSSLPTMTPAASQ